MPTLENNHLINLIRFTPVVVVFVFALAVNLIAIQANREQAEESIKNLREELTLERKEAIRSEVHQVYTNLLIEQSKIERTLKNNAKQRVYEAYAIASYIYTQNLDKPKDEVTRLIVEALRPIRFFDGRGYFFIIGSDGLTIMNGANPELEGKNGWNIQDKDGNFIARKMLAITKKKGEGFLDWRFKKPNSESAEAFDKLGYIKKFEPYNWSIATGEYVEQFESTVKKRLLNWLSEYEYGEHGYFFVLDKSGTLLTHHANDFLGLDFVIGEQVKEALVSDINSQLEHGGGYIRFNKSLTMSGSANLEQVSYVKQVPRWGWIIGTGFSSQAFEKNLRLKEQHLLELNHQSFIRLLYLTVISLLLLTITSLFIGNSIARRFELFQGQIKNDFNELNKTKNKMEYMALHDALTDLPNRVLMRKEIQANIELAEAEQNMFAVMFVDLDNFKKVNDLFGHDTGNQLLVKVSERFKLIADGCGSVSRHGGDEFIFCFTPLKDKREAESKAKQIIDALANPIVIEGKLFSITSSIGISMYPNDADNPETLIGYADTVLYKSKADKKGQFLFYSSRISEQIKRKMQIEHELIHAIEQKSLSVQYQPQISTSTKKLVGVEALVRWHHEVLGPIYPDEFISIAEEFGLIHELDMFVFETACEDIFALSPNGESALNLSVNISPLQLLEQDFAARLIAISNNIGIAHERITIEITENIFIHGFDTVKPVLSELRNEGFKLSLDDFGTGYSSLSYINSLPLTEIKIDRSFTMKFLDFYQSDMLVRMIINIGRLCGLVVVAEGVETKEQYQKLLKYGCDLVQGYYFARPLTIAQLSEKDVTQQVDNALSLPLTSDEINAQG